MLAAAYPQLSVPRFSIGCAYAAGVAANAFLPARGGEALKVALARTQLPASSIPTIAASLSVVIVLDALLGGSLIVVFWATGILPSLPPVPAAGYLPFVLPAVAVLMVVAAVLVRRLGGALRRIASSIVQGLSILRSPVLYVRTVLPYQLCAWACRIGVVFFVLQAFHIEASLATAALVVVLNGVSTVVPVPGGGGSQQVMATYALQGVISATAAVSFSLGMQVGVTVVNTAVGLAAVMLLFRTLRPVVALRAVGLRDGR